MSASYLLRVEHVGRVDSTMDVARKRSRQGAEEGTTIVAESQEQGRGRRGRPWFSPPGAGVWATTILRPRGRPPHTLGPVCAVAVAEAMREVGAEQARIKWPNDIVIEGRKLAGILLEGDDLGGADPVVLVGIGINVAPAQTLDLPGDLAARYIGMMDLLPQHRRVELTGDNLHEEILGAALARLKHWYELWCLQGPAAIRDAWPAWDALVGSAIRAEGSDGPVVGIARGIDAEGRLRIDTPDGPITISSGEVERILNGKSATPSP